ncbi:MAG: CHAD domain-containing protein [Timaviella obliquedivisa GSE-PSE-MK23-08B]|jgi:CHAD domain-containing protein|nr:CHAD domain-containing protein [Timaviella obliquedivisa GSE-PSE-MK23-08B]
MIELQLHDQPLSELVDRPSPVNTTLGDYAYTIINKQFYALKKQKQNVLADQNPEHLHKMRVAARRLQSALQVFDTVIELPKAAQLKQVRFLGKALGKLRDLDVQTAAVKDHYSPLLNSSEQETVQTLLKHLQKDRHQAFSAVETILTRSPYKKIKAAYEDWLSCPQYRAIAQLPLAIAIPELVNPLLSALLLHPGWLISAQLPEPSQDTEAHITLHDLRKAFKAVRYQSEFFETFYDSAFQNWIEELKTLQENLGKVQDGYILLEILRSQKVEVPGLQDAISKDQRQAMANWEPIRQQYLSSDFRQQLHQMILGNA